MRMQHTLIAAAMLSLLFLRLVEPLNAQPADDKGPCVQILTACREAGFTFGGAEAGIGLYAHCIDPIMQGRPKPPRARIPPPRLDGALVAACRASNPRFGQGGVRPEEPRLPAKEPSPEGTTSPAAANTEAERLKAWRKSMAHTTLPRSGCSEAEYPSLQWREVPCVTAEPLPYDPVTGGPEPENVGNHHDFVAHTTGISSADGSFEITGVTSEYRLSQSGSAGAPNGFSLQLNANTFPTSKCKGGGPHCYGWQQFIFSTQACKDKSGSRVPCAFIQYWLKYYGDNCPYGGKNASCFRNSPSVIVPSQTITDLAHLSLIGIATPGGDDSVVVTAGTKLYAIPPQSDQELGLGGQWDDAEFNVFGDCCYSQAVFNYGSAVIVHLSVENGTKNAPSCINSGYTGETNNLSLVGTCSSQGGANPGITFKESYCNSCGVTCCAAGDICFDPKTSICKSAIGGGGVGPGGGGSVGFPNCGTPDTPPCHPTLPGQGGPKPKTIE